MDRNTVKRLRERINGSLLVLEEDYDVKVGNATFDRMGSVTFKVIISERDANGVALTPEATAFKTLATIYGLKSDDLGRVFIYQGKKYRISGLASRASKMPILATSEADERTYKFAAEAVVRALA